MGVIYRHTVESLVSVVRKKQAMTDGQLTELGVFPPRDTPMDVWVPAVRAMSNALFPMLPPERQLEESGRELMRSFTTGLVGGGLLMVLKIAGRRRALLRMTENFRTADSVMQVTSVEKSPRWFQLHFDQGYSLEQHMLGILREAMMMIDAKEPCTVESTTDARGGFTVDVKW